MLIEIGKPTQISKKINLPEIYFNQIMSSVGFPIATLDLLEFSGDIDSFKELVVEPALETYFTYFPLIYSKDYTVSSASFEFPFPDDEVDNIFYAVLKINSFTPMMGQTKLYNPFVSAQYISPANQISYSIGSKYDYGLFSALISKESELISRINHYKSTRYDVDINNRKVVGFTNITGAATIDFMSYSLDFMKVSFYHRQDMIKLCKANLLKILAMIRGQSNKDSENQGFNYDLFLTTSNDLTKEVIDKWSKSVHDPVVVRM